MKKKVLCSIVMRIIEILITLKVPILAKEKMGPSMNLNKIITIIKDTTNSHM
jgi:hypothetical protein